MHYIDGEWIEGQGEGFSSQDLAKGELIGSGKQALKEEVEKAVSAARKSFPGWRKLSFEERVGYVRLFEENLKNSQSELAELISQETGKPLWESHSEISSMLQKIETSLTAFQERCPEKELKSSPTTTLHIQHKPHGVLAVFGPFNFPGHLPNGHIVPGLLAGNTIVFKGSEYTPGVSEKMVHLWNGLPKGVLNLIQGGPITGHHLIAHPQIDGVLFTGSYKTGMIILDSLKLHPEKIIALEMGGNNPLVVHDVSDLEAAAYLTILSAFLTAGQRCTCARRLIIPEGKEGDAFLKVFVQMSTSIKTGLYKMQPEPFMGPVISIASAERLLNIQATLGAQGGKCLLEMRPLDTNVSLLSPGIMDVTAVLHRKDEEIFGPFLQVVRVPSFEAAIVEANHTAYGLVAALFSRSKTKFHQFYQEIRAGVINWNTPTTGASGKAPFGGIGKSGNHRPSGYYAPDYCAYPVASMESEEICIPKQPISGITSLART